MADVEIIFAGELNYDIGRELQNQFASQIDSGGPEAIIFCEHPAVVTAGKSVGEGEFCRIESGLRNRGIECIRTDRGGAFTYHGPGQLLIYPMINLRKRHLGIKSFIEKSLSNIAIVINEYNIKSEVRVSKNETGLWVNQKNISKKIASAGLRIANGITNHGFSFNVDVDLSVYNLFSACNLSAAQITSLHEICDERERPSIREIEAKLSKVIIEKW